MALTVIKSTSTNFTGNTVSIATQYGGSVPPIVLNDITNYFDGTTSVFPLMLDQTNINTIIDSKDVTVTLNGLLLQPYVKENRLPWIAEFDSHKGYKVSGGNLIIYNAPDNGDWATVMIVSSSQAAQERKYPFSANTIALGD